MISTIGIYLWTLFTHNINKNNTKTVLYAEKKQRKGNVREKRS